MFRLAKWLPCVAALAAALTLGTASPARADIEITLTDGTHTSSNTSPSDLVATATTSVILGGGNLTVTGASGTSTSPGSSTIAETAGVVFNPTVGFLSITNSGSSSETVTLIVSATNFTAPTSPPALTLLDTVSGTVLGTSPSNTVVTGTANAYVDFNNTMYSSVPVAGSTTLAGQALSFSANGPSSSFQGTVNGSVSPLNVTATPYSITFVETLTLSAGAEIELTGGNGSLIPTPAPTSLMTAFTALPFFGIGAWLRRRGKQAA